MVDDSGVEGTLTGILIDSNTLVAPQRRVTISNRLGGGDSSLLITAYSMELKRVFFVFEYF
jgi:hypothetical protein